MGGRSGQATIDAGEEVTEGEFQWIEGGGFSRNFFVWSAADGTFSLASRSDRQGGILLSVVVAAWLLFFRRLLTLLQQLFCLFVRSNRSLPSAAAFGLGVQCLGLGSHHFAGNGWGPGRVCFCYTGCPPPPPPLYNVVVNKSLRRQ